jgi:hypothetical protein
VTDDFLDSLRRVRKQRDRIERRQRAGLSVEKLLAELRSQEEALTVRSHGFESLFDA